MSELPRFVLVSAVDVVALAELLQRVVSAPEPVVVLVRDKSLPRSERMAITERVLEIARPRRHHVWISESADIAKELGLDGVHLGGTPDESTISNVRAVVGEGVWINAACHDVDDVRRAAAFAPGSRPDSVFLSPIFESPGKGAPLGANGLSSARAILRARRELGEHAPKLIALGGIDASRAQICFRAGADAVAAIARAPFGCEPDAVRRPT